MRRAIGADDPAGCGRRKVKIPVLAALVLLTACAPAPKPVEGTKSDVGKRDPTKDVSYIQGVQRLAVLNHEAESLFRRGKSDQAAAVMEKAKPVMDRILAAPRPTLEAMEAASDLDDLYGRMLLANRHYGWARLSFQKNLVRWKHWDPKTPEVERRWKQAEAAISECDRRME